MNPPPRTRRRLNPVLKAFLLLLGLGAALSAIAVFVIGSRGISAKAEPGWLETALARTMRSFAIPRRDRDLQNPVPVSADVMASGMSHYADHCAACHANDGSGETEIGRGLYPKPADMRLPATQSLTDGELFYIIENGIRLTGMPAWGTGNPENGEGTWHLVHFIRKLPTLTPAELEQMQTMNPRSPADLREAEETRKFLEGTGEAPKPAPAHKHGGGGS
jgi:mono/diheme cytochrome c family protein